MIRLIDADELYERTLSIKNSFARRTMEYLISTQPTAFDKEKVIEELEELLDRDSVECGLDWNKAINKAIEIVERGGVDER